MVQQSAQSMADLPLPWFGKLLLKLKHWGSILRDIIYGATIYEMVRDLNKERGEMERFFVLIVFGDLFGIPILPPFYTLRLIPYVLPKIAGWRRSVLRERDLVDLCDQDIT
jgi:hypothetical protein